MKCIIFLKGGVPAPFRRPIRTKWLKRRPFPTRFWIALIVIMIIIIIIDVVVYIRTNRIYEFEYILKQYIYIHTYDVLVLVRTYIITLP